MINVQPRAAEKQKKVWCALRTINGSLLAEFSNSLLPNGSRITPQRGLGDHLAVDSGTHGDGKPYPTTFEPGQVHIAFAGQVQPQLGARGVIRSGDLVTFKRSSPTVQQIPSPPARGEGGPFAARLRNRTPDSHASHPLLIVPRGPCDRFENLTPAEVSV